MTRPEIIESLTQIFRQVFQDDALAINDAMTAKDVPKWDSISHLDLICTVEETFSIRLSTREVLGLKNVGDLIAAIEKYAGKK